MRKHWPSKEQDLQDAAVIIDKYSTEEGDPVRLLDFSYNNKQKQLQIRAPEWMVEMSNHFDDKYGSDIGRDITKKVITKYLLRDVTIH